MATPIFQRTKQDDSYIDEKLQCAFLIRSLTNISNAPQFSFKMSSWPPLEKFLVYKHGLTMKLLNRNYSSEVEETTFMMYQNWRWTIMVCPSQLSGSTNIPRGFPHESPSTIQILSP